MTDEYIELRLMKWYNLAKMEVLTWTASSVRIWLKTKGWVRKDRHGEELWEAPFDLKWTSAGVSLLSAVKAQLRHEGYDTTNLKI